MLSMFGASLDLALVLMLSQWADLLVRPFIFGYRQIINLS